MIEIILFVALGFLAAALLGLVVAPAIYRRVVVLTERRMRSTVPLNAAEIQASKDMERAAFAAENSRINVELRKEREQLTDERARKSRLSETVAKMRSQNEELKTNLGDLKEETGQLRSNLRIEESNLLETRQELDRAQKGNKEKERQIQNMIDKANRLSTEVGSLKIDLASKDTESENLRSTIESLKTEQRKLQKTQDDIESHALKLEADLQKERDQTDKLEHRLRTANAKVENRDQKLEARAEEVKRIKDNMQAVKSEASELRRTLRTSENERRALERRLSKVEKQLTSATGKTIAGRKPVEIAIPKPAKIATPAKQANEATKPRTLAPGEIAERVDKLRARHNSLVENLNKKSNGIDDGEFRRELAEIAAMMIDLTAAREGEQSKLYGMFKDHEITAPGQGKKPSLADRATRRIEKTNADVI